MVLGRTRRRRWRRATQRGGEYPTENFGECVRAMRGTGTRTRGTGVLLTGLRRGGGEAADGGSRAAAQLGFGGGVAAARKLGFGVKRAVKQPL
jgi:hypothetical protein